jgi:hypothetical protein
MFLYELTMVKKIVVDARGGFVVRDEALAPLFESRPAHAGHYAHRNEHQRRFCPQLCLVHAPPFALAGGLILAGLRPKNGHPRSTREELRTLPLTSCRSLRSPPSAVGLTLGCTTDVKEVMPKQRPLPGSEVAYHSRTAKHISPGCATGDQGQQPRAL